MDWILQRLSEQSTWRGIIGLSTAFGITLAPDAQNAIIALGLAAIGLINILRKEKAAKVINSTAPVTVEAPATVTTKE